MAGPVAQRGIPSAAGYPQYQNTFLMPPIFSDRMLELFYCESIFSRISTTDYLGELKGKGDTIYFLKEPCMIVRDYTKDQILEHDTFEPDTCKVRVGLAKYFSLKIDKLDEQMMQNWPMYRTKLIENASRSFSQRIDCEMLAQVYTDVNCNNRGALAGVVTRSYDLGTPGSPRLVNRTNIIEFLTNLQAVLDEQCIPTAGRYIVVPPQFKVELMNSELRQACFLNCNTGTSTIANGDIPMELVGFRFIVTNCAPSVQDAVAGVKAWYVIAGLPMATAFVALADMSRDIEDKDSFGLYIQSMMAYGFAVIYSQALAVGYIRF